MYDFCKDTNKSLNKGPKMLFLFCFFLLFVFEHFIVVNKFGYNEKK